MSVANRKRAKSGEKITSANSDVSAPSSPASANDRVRLSSRTVSGERGGEGVRRAGGDRQPWRQASGPRVGDPREIGDYQCGAAKQERA